MNELTLFHNIPAREIDVANREDIRKCKICGYLELKKKDETFCEKRLCKFFVIKKITTTLIIVTNNLIRNF